MSDGITAYYLAYQGAAVRIDGHGGFSLSNEWFGGICDVTIFPTPEVAQDALRTIQRLRSLDWRGDWDIRRIYAPHKDAREKAGR